MKAKKPTFQSLIKLFALQLYVPHLLIPIPRFHWPCLVTLGSILVPYQFLWVCRFFSSKRFALPTLCEGGEGGGGVRKRDLTNPTFSKLSLQDFFISVLAWSSGQPGTTAVPDPWCQPPLQVTDRVAWRHPTAPPGPSGNHNLPTTCRYFLIPPPTRYPSVQCHDYRVD